MASLQIVGWQPGFKKVSMTDALQRHLGLSLEAAKATTDKVLDGLTVTLTSPDPASTGRLAEELRALGASVTLDELDPATALSMLIDRYIAGEMGFMPFWSAFMNAYVDSGLSADEEREFESAYDIVYMGNDVALTQQERGEGLLEEGEVRAALAAFQARRRGSQAV